jgi:hypothetical protein
MTKQNEEQNTVGYFSTSLTPYYDRNGITIYCGETLETMSKIDGVFDAIIADLPYG